MKITKIGSDFVTIDENNFDQFTDIPKVHIIKLSFFYPSMEKILKVIDLYPKTNRFVVDSDIRKYNTYLKRTSKKYYVENLPGVGIISFFRKNNKVLLNFSNLMPEEKVLLLEICLEDLLKNVEVIRISREDFESKEDIFKTWNGNIIIQE